MRAQTPPKMPLYEGFGRPGPKPRTKPRSIFPKRARRLDEKPKKKRGFFMGLVFVIYIKSPGEPLKKPRFFFWLLVEAPCPFWEKRAWLFAWLFFWGAWRLDETLIFERKKRFASTKRSFLKR